jgi:hypothetical protein
MFTRSYIAASIAYIIHECTFRCCILPRYEGPTTVDLEIGPYPTDQNASPPMCRFHTSGQVVGDYFSAYGILRGNLDT